jgi:hypothetical protein
MAHILRFYAFEISRLGKSTQTKHRMVVARGWAWVERMRNHSLKGTEFPFGVIKMFWNNIEGLFDTVNV